MRIWRPLALGAALLACILAANYVTSRFGLVPVGFGLAATAGTYFAGLALVLRDSLQDVGGKRWVVAVIAAGAVSERRYRYAHALGCDSADGTFLTFGPDANLPRFKAWLRTADQGLLPMEAS